MGSIKESISRYKRRYIQLISAVLCNCHLSGFLSGNIYKGKTKNLCVPGLNCYSCPGAVAACPVGSLQYALSGSVFRFPFYVLGTLILFGVLLGRLICGFLCPFGLIQELLDKIPVPKIKKSRITRILSYFKYIVLFAFVMAIPLIKHEPGFCKYICPAGTIEAAIPLLLTDKELMVHVGPLFIWKASVSVAIVFLCMFCYRAFCRFLCPLGAFYSFFNPVAFFGISVDKDKCTGCNACIKICKTDVHKVGDHECIHCGACADVCPEGAIYYRNPIKRNTNGEKS